MALLARQGFVALLSQQGFVALLSRQGFLSEPGLVLHLSGQAF